MGPLLNAEFARHLDAYGLTTLERDPCVIYGVDSRLRLGFVNHAFERFWRQNGGEGSAAQWACGRNVLSAISGPLRDYYREAFERALRTGEPWAHDYECHSPTTFRLCRMEVLPLHDGAGLLAVHSRVEERPHAPGPSDALDDRSPYVRADGYMLQCSNCRRVKLVGSEPPRWDWVPRLVEEHLERVSHGICRLCVGQYYGEYVAHRV